MIVRLLTRSVREDAPARSEGLDPVDGVRTSYDPRRVQSGSLSAFVRLFLCANAESQVQSGLLQLLSGKAVLVDNLETGLGEDASSVWSGE